MLKNFTLVLGLILTAAGIWGMATGGGQDHVLVLFGINTTHNAVHILSGVVAIAAALSNWNAAKLFCLIFGTVYGVVAVAGFAQFEQVVTMLNLNTADNWLHSAIAAACLFFGLTGRAY